MRTSIVTSLRIGRVVAVASVSAILAAGCGSANEATRADTSLDTTTSETPETLALVEETTTSVAEVATTTTAPPETTVTTVEATTTTQAPTTVAPTMTIHGEVAFLDSGGVWFEGRPDAPAISRPAAGASCQGYDGYSDLSAGGTVIVSDSSGAALATTTLGSGFTVDQVLGTESEQFHRSDLIDAIYGLRVAQAESDRVRVSQLELERAQVRLADLEAGGLPPFEGSPFMARWCHVTFVVSDLPVVDTYQITVTHRGTNAFTRNELETQGVALLVVG